MLPSLTIITEGLAPAPGARSPFSAAITGGMPAAPVSAVGSTPTDTAYALANIVGARVPVPNLSTLGNIPPEVIRADVINTDGKPIAPNPIGALDLGNGQVLTFDYGDFVARAIPAVNPAGPLYDDPGSSSFTASDCLIMVEVPQAPLFNGSSIKTRVAKQLVEANTLSVSIHRSKAPVRAFGHANPVGFARGSRTIAGTLVLSKSTAEVLYRFLQSGLVADLTKDTIYAKLDQLPPLDFTLLFTNEMGYVSSQRLLGVEFVDDGTVISVQDILMEQQITWTAADITPLAPLNFQTFFSPSTADSNATATQRTPGQVIEASMRATNPMPAVQRGGDPAPIPPVILQTLSLPGAVIQ